MTAATTLTSEHQSPGSDAIGVAALAIADELTGYSLDVRNPEWSESRLLKITNARGLLSEILIGADGSVEWECRPCDRRPADPARTAEMVRRVLGGEVAAGPAEALAGPFSFTSVVGRMLASCGLAVTMDVHVDEHFFEAYADIDVTNPGQPGRGHVCVADDGSIWWRCRITEEPGDSEALSLSEVAGVVAQALTDRDHA